MEVTPKIDYTEKCFLYENAGKESINMQKTKKVSDSIGDRWQLPEDICVITRGSAEKVNLDDSKLLAKLKEQIII